MLCFSNKLKKKSGFWNANALVGIKLNRHQSNGLSMKPNETNSYVRNEFHLRPFNLTFYCAVDAVFLSQVALSLSLSFYLASSSFTPFRFMRAGFVK